MLTGSTLGVVTDSLSFNGFAETTQYQAKINGDNAYKAEYSYDKLGRIVQKIETIAGDAPVTHAYGYDAAGRLSSVKIGAAETTYGYDSNGNRTSINGATVGSYDDQDRLTNYNGAGYAYTANGELKSKTEGGGTTNYQYDLLGNLRQVSFANGDKIDYAIDALDRRVGRKAVIGGVTTEQRFLYQDGLKIVAELDGNNQVVSRFVYGARVNVPDYMIKDGNTYRLITDHLGSPRVVINTATGAIAQRIEYDAWGKVLSDSNPGFQPFGFAGGLYDRQTGLVRFGARDYEAETGRWSAKDPIGFNADDTNFYAYGSYDPVNGSDPEGLKTIKVPIYEWRWVPKIVVIGRDNCNRQITRDDGSWQWKIVRYEFREVPESTPIPPNSFKPHDKLGKTSTLGNLGKQFGQFSQTGGNTSNAFKSHMDGK